MTGTRADQFSVTVSVSVGSDTRDLGVFDKQTGGEADSDETKYRAGAMAGQISLGGYKNIGNITVSRLFREDRDAALMPFLLGAVGKGIVTVSKQPLDVDGNVIGKPLVYSEGRLKKVTPPEHDSESNAAAMLELEVSTGSQVTQAA